MCLCVCLSTPVAQLTDKMDLCIMHQNDSPGSHNDAHPKKKKKKKKKKPAHQLCCVFLWGHQNWKKGGIASAWRAGGSHFAAFFVSINKPQMLYTLIVFYWPPLVQTNCILSSPTSGQGIYDHWRSLSLVVGCVRKERLVCWSSGHLCYQSTNRNSEYLLTNSSSKWEICWCVWKSYIDIQTHQTFFLFRWNPKKICSF